MTGIGRRDPAAQATGIGRTAQRHAAAEVVAQQPQCMLGAGLARRGQAVEGRPPELDRVGPERDRLGDVGAVAEAAIDQHRQFAGGRVDHGRQRVDRGAGAIELTPAVV